MLMPQESSEGIPGAGALGELFENHSRQVLSAAYRVTGSRQDAEDALQTVFLRLAGRWRDLNLSDTPGAYLRRAAVNAAIDLLRSRSAAGAVPLEDMPFEISDRSDVSAERQRQDSEFRQRLRKALLVLTDRNATVFCLRYFEEFTNKEIAAALGVSQTRVAVILHRARKRLQQELLDFVKGEAS